MRALAIFLLLAVAVGAEPIRMTIRVLSCPDAHVPCGYNYITIEDVGPEDRVLIAVEGGHMGATHGITMTTGWDRLEIMGFGPGLHDDPPRLTGAGGGGWADWLGSTGTSIVTTEGTR